MRRAVICSRGVEVSDWLGLSMAGPQSFSVAATWELIAVIVLLLERQPDSLSQLSRQQYDE